MKSIPHRSPGVVSLHVACVVATVMMACAGCVDGDPDTSQENQCYTHCTTRAPLPAVTCEATAVRPQGSALPLDPSFNGTAEDLAARLARALGTELGQALGMRADGSPGWAAGGGEVWATANRSVSFRGEAPQWPPAGATRSGAEDAAREILHAFGVPMYEVDAKVGNSKAIVDVAVATPAGPLPVGQAVAPNGSAAWFKLDAFPSLARIGSIVIGADEAILLARVRDQCDMELNGHVKPHTGASARLGWHEGRLVWEVRIVRGQPTPGDCDESGCRHGCSAYEFAAYVDAETGFWRGADHTRYLCI